jgi:aromatic ring-opening dioxygenase catalytic subunit (LigB family)
MYDSMTFSKMPTFYIPHGGGPCFFMEWTMGPRDTWDRTAAFLRGLPNALPAAPTALLVVSAHWESAVPTVTASSAPALIYDYAGFPPHTYSLTWPAPGSPELAHRVVALLARASIPAAMDGERGFDHGTFIPLKVAYPEASVPTVQLSLKRGLGPSEHLALGRALEPLRAEGVLLIASGMSYHDMRGFMTSRGREDSERFDTWMRTAVAMPESERSAQLADWASAPAARRCHPREEHWMPLLVAAGAAGEDAGTCVFSDVVMGVRVSALRFG